MNSLFATGNISFLLVFAEGLLSFFSPCIVPLIPVYMGYLAGSTSGTDSQGQTVYNRKKVFFHTVLFVLGISTAFFILGLSFTAIGSFFQSHQLMFARIGGVLIILLGLVQVGFFELKFLNREKRIPLDLSGKKVNPLFAYLMGFTFSFAWTPCVGPMLSSVLILASGASSALTGNLLVLVYALGFIIPFLLLGLFTTQVLNFLKRHQSLMKYTVKAGGILLIAIGIMTYTGWMNNISGYLNSFVPEQSESTPPVQQEVTENAGDREPQAGLPEDTGPQVPAMDFTLTDQYDQTHTLSEYRGKVVFLNFWATWCPPCREEMPDIEALYLEYGSNQEDVVFLGVAGPRTEENPNTRETEKDGILQFLDDNGYTFPVVFDETGDVYSTYRITSLPTTFIIGRDGNILGYAPGMLTRDIMISVVEQALAVPYDEQ